MAGRVESLLRERLAPLVELRDALVALSKDVPVGGSLDAVNSRMSDIVSEHVDSLLDPEQD
jgi:hypothetical protein